MSIRVRKGLDGVNWAVTVCDDCQVELDRKRAEPHERPDCTLLVRTLCKACADFPSARANVTLSLGRSLGIGNVAAVRKVDLHLETISEPPTRRQTVTTEAAIRVNKCIDGIKALKQSSYTPEIVNSLLDNLQADLRRSLLCCAQDMQYLADTHQAGHEFLLELIDRTADQPPTPPHGQDGSTIFPSKKVHDVHP